MQIGDALACLAEEGRTRPRKSSGSCHEAVIRRCPNGLTPAVEILWSVLLCKTRVSWGTEISKYPEEKKSKEIPLVSDERTGNSPNPIFMGGCRTLISYVFFVKEHCGISDQRA